MLEPTPSASLLILTIMLLMILFFRVIMITGDRTPSIGSPVVTIPNCQGLISGFFSPAVRQLTPFQFSGLGIRQQLALFPSLSNCQSSETHGSVSCQRNPNFTAMEVFVFLERLHNRWCTPEQICYGLGLLAQVPGITPVILFLVPDNSILMLLFCESTFAVPGPLYVARGFALCLMESVTLVIRRYLVEFFICLNVSCLLCFHVGFCLVPPWYHRGKGLFICYIFMCPFIPVFSPVCCSFAFVSLIGFSQYFSPIFSFSRYLSIRFLGL